MKKVNYKKIIELLAYVLHCPVCNTKYTAEQTNIIGAEEGTEKFEDSSMLVHTDCVRCQSSVVFNISLEGPELFSVGMVTDLTSDDAKKFKEAENITSEDVLAFHDYLRRFDGNFTRILA